MQRDYQREPRTCSYCTTLFIPTGQNQKYCTKVCRKQANPLTPEQYERYMRKRVKQYGVGKGGTVGSWENNPAFKHGLGAVKSRRNEIKQQRRYCEHCEKDLQESTHYQWVIHHKDHNKYNNPKDGSNWMLLCKKCHQVEHKCWTAFEGATTRVYPVGSK